MLKQFVPVVTPFTITGSVAKAVAAVVKDRETDRTLHKSEQDLTKLKVYIEEYGDEFNIDVSGAPASSDDVVYGLMYFVSKKDYRIVTKARTK